MGKKRNIIILFSVLFVALILAAVLRKISRDTHGMTEEEMTREENIRYGTDVNGYRMTEDVIRPGENLSGILARFGVSARTVDSLVRCTEGVFDLRSIRAGQQYKAFLSPDTVKQRLCHFVYERNRVDYVVFSFGDSIAVRTDSKEVRRKRCVAGATIESSLWNAMVANDLSPALAMNLSDIYAWTIDFFGLQPGDRFQVIYDEEYVDTMSIGVGRIWGAWFESGGKRFYAVPFEQDGKISYWDEQGNSLRKNLLKAPLKFSRISSRFSNSRLHPVLKIRRPHHGVDYAAPSGTPVHAVADGVVIAKGYSGGGGNTVKIRHSRGLVTGYLHLRGYAKGLAVGKRVSQGQLIGYVGATGLATGPHLDFRIWRNGQPIDPLKVPSEPAEPISEANRAQFMKVKELVFAGLDGSIPADSIALAPFFAAKSAGADSLR